MGSWGGGSGDGLCALGKLRNGVPRPLPTPRSTRDFEACPPLLAELRDLKVTLRNPGGTGGPEKQVPSWREERGHQSQMSVC